MPRIVDREAKRSEIGEAVWRVARRDGLEGATVRAVAAEAGMSTGAMRHYFEGHAELQYAAMTGMLERVAERVALEREQAGPGGSPTRAILLQLLPLDDERRAESEVWLSFVSRAGSEPSFRALADATYDALRSLVVEVIAEYLPGADPARADLEAERLFALIDGLVLHAVQRPDQRSAERMTAVVDRHLESLAP